MDSCYVPNNPQFGLQLECQWGQPQEQQQQHHQHHHHQQQHQQQQPPQPQPPPQPPPLSPVWPTAEDMASFSVPLDLDPLPSLFPFSPGTNFKTEMPPSPMKEPKQPHDVADVLLSLKHAVVHPGQSASPGFSASYPQQQLSYTVHPHQMLMSPNGYSNGGLCDQPGSMFGGTASGGCHQTHQPAPAAVFPSMSVNVSMNMTMHGYHPTTPAYADQMGCSQVQWNTQPTSSPNYVQNQGLLSPSYTSGATYSFTADFRPPTVAEVPLITATSSFKPVISSSGKSFSPVGMRTRRHSINYSSLSPGKVQMGLCSDEEIQRPNLCRICGKTYARPSTLKTHLRTHSGEKPYRCADCNKSFSQAANLTAHVRTHSGEKPFRCPICDRRFSQSSSVTTHMRTHSGERPYRCRMCKKAFSDSSTLTKHLRIHSGEKPYQCKLCLLRFSQSGNLNRHMRVHGGSGAVVA